MKHIGCFFILAHLANGLYSQNRPEIEWVDIPSGSFVMGSPKKEIDRGNTNDETQHTVHLSAFRMSKYEVTFEQYDAFCDSTGRKKPDDEGWGRGNRPVINVSWDDANAFALWMGCRLPTEAEWEYACRAGTTTPFNTGKCISTDDANYCGDYPYKGCRKGQFRGSTMPVGSFPPNAWGLYDMHGNVMEWCSNWYAEYPVWEETVSNPQGPAKGWGRVYRGGCWGSRAKMCRSAIRSYGVPERRVSSRGFRIVSSS